MFDAALMRSRAAVTKALLKTACSCAVNMSRRFLFSVSIAFWSTVGAQFNVAFTGNEFCSWKFTWSRCTVNEKLPVPSSTMELGGTDIVASAPWVSIDTPVRWKPACEQRTCFCGMSATMWSVASAKPRLVSEPLSKVSSLEASSASMNGMVRFSDSLNGAGGTMSCGCGIFDRSGGAPTCTSRARPSCAPGSST